MPVHVLKERTYLDAKGKATTDEAKAVSLLGTENDELDEDTALQAGLIKSPSKKSDAPEAKLLFYNAEGKKVAEGDPSATVQYLDNDPARPDAPKKAGAAGSAASRTTKAAAASSSDGE